MHFSRVPHSVLPLFIILILSSCSSTPKGHYGQFIFHGEVKSIDGKPISKAQVKLLGTTTSTDEQGLWKQTHHIHCVGWANGGDSFENENGLEIQMKGFEPYKESFAEKFKLWSKYCGEKKEFEFETVLKTKKSKASL